MSSAIKYISEQEKITHRGLLQCYNNKDVVTTLEAMQTTSDFYHHKMTDMLKLACAQPNLANICLHKSTDHKLYPLFSSHSDLLEKKNGKV